MIGKIVLLLLAVILLLVIAALLIPAYVRVSYERGEFRVFVKYAWLTIPVYPGTKQETEERPQPVEKEQSPAKEKTTINREQILYSFDTLPSVLLKALRRTGKRIRIEPLKVHVLVATPDPADTAVLYGKIHAGLAATLPSLHRTVKIREQDIQLFPDFSEESMDIIADIGIGIRPGDLLLIALLALGGILRWYSGFKKRATKEVPKTQDNNVDTTAQADTAA